MLPLDVTLVYQEKIPSINAIYSIVVESVLHILLHIITYYGIQLVNDVRNTAQSPNDFQSKFYNLFHVFYLIHQYKLNSIRFFDDV